MPLLLLKGKKGLQGRARVCIFEALSGKPEHKTNRMKAVGGETGGFFVPKHPKGVLIFLKVIFNHLYKWVDLNELSPLYLHSRRNAVWATCWHFPHLCPCLPVVSVVVFPI